MSETRRFLHGAAWSAATILVNMAALLAIGKMATNALSSEVVGAFSLLLTGGDFLIVLLSVGLCSTLPKLVAGAEEDRRPPLIGAVLAFALLVVSAGAAITLATAGLGGYGPAGFLPDSWRGITAYLWLLPLLFIVGVYRDMLLAIQAGLDQYANRATAMALGSLFQVGAIYLVIWRFGWGNVITFILCMTAGYLLGIGWSMRVVRRTLSFSEGLAPAGPAVRFSLPMHANTVLVFLYQRADTLLVGALLGLAPAAVLEMIKRLPMMLTRILGATLVPYLPSMSRCIAAGDTDAALRLAGRASRTVVFLGHGACLVVLIFREPLIKLLFSESYVAGADALGLLFYAAVLSLQSGLLTQALIALGRNRSIVVVNIAVVGLGVAGNIALAPRYGLVGVGAAAAAAIAFGVWAQACWMRRCGFNLSWYHLAAAHGCMLPAAFLSYGFDSWAIRGGAVAIFVAGSAILRVIRYEDVNAVLQALRPVRN